MLEGILFLLAITFLTALAFVLVLLYFNIIKKKFKIGLEKTTKEERDGYGWLVLDFNFNLFGKRITYKSKKKSK